MAELKPRGQLMHFWPVTPSLSIELISVCSLGSDSIVYFLLACVRHRGREGVFVGAGFRVSKLRGWVASCPPVQSCICRLCTQPADYSNISQEQTCSWLGIIKLSYTHTGIIHPPNALLLTFIFLQRLCCMRLFTKTDSIDRQHFTRLHKQHMTSTLQPLIFIGAI